MFPKIAHLILIVVFLFTGCVSISFAEGQSLSNNCSITIKSIKGIERINNANSKDIILDKRISDLRSQLEDLSFARFEFIDSVSNETKFNKDVNFKLRCAMGNVHRINILPHSLNDGKVDVSISWMSPSGETMLASRMKLTNGENVVLGTEHPEETCTIIAVDIECRN